MREVVQYVFVPLMGGLMAVVVMLLINRIMSHRRSRASADVADIHLPRLELDDEEECDVAVIVVKGRENQTLLIDDVHKRVIRMGLMPGMRANSIGVGIRDSRGSLHVLAKELDHYGPEDFEQYDKPPPDDVGPTLN